MDDQELWGRLFVALPVHTNILEEDMERILGELGGPDPKEQLDKWVEDRKMLRRHGMYYMR